MPLAQCWLAGLVFQDTIQSLDAGPCRHPAVRTPSPFLEIPGVVDKAKSSPLGWAIRCGVLPEDQGVQVCQVGLGGLPNPFLQGLPDLLSGPGK